MMIDVETEETITCFNPRIIKSYSKEVVLEEAVYHILVSFLMRKDQIL